MHNDLICLIWLLVGGLAGKPTGETRKTSDMSTRRKNERPVHQVETDVTNQGRKELLSQRSMGIELLHECSVGFGGSRWSRSNVHGRSTFFTLGGAHKCGGLKNVR